MCLFILMLFLLVSFVFVFLDEVWDQFCVDVQIVCIVFVFVEGEIVIEVNFFGLESYGVVLLIIMLFDGGVDCYVCIYDKQIKKVEISGVFIDFEDQVSMGGNVFVNCLVFSIDVSLLLVKFD